MRYDSIFVIFFVVPGTTKCDLYPFLTIYALFLMVPGTTKCYDYPGTTIFVVPGTKCYDNDFYPVLEYSTIFALPRMTMSTCYGDFSPIFVNFCVNES
jgi:hypothetical protein